MRSSIVPGDYLNDPLLQWMLPVYLAAVLLSAAHSAITRRGWYEGRDSLTSLSMLVA